MSIPRRAIAEKLTSFNEAASKCSRKSEFFADLSGCCAASMRPRARARGNFCLHQGQVSVRHASMRPRASARGNSCVLKVFSFQISAGHFANGGPKELRPIVKINFENILNHRFQRLASTSRNSDITPTLAPFLYRIPEAEYCK